MSLHPSYWNNLLRLLALMVLIDKKVYQEEVAAFTKAALQLRDSVSPGMMMTRKMTVDWFINHRERVEAVVDTLSYDDELLDIIKPLRGLPQKTEVMKAMIEIALSDGFYHDKEKMIVKKAILYWNINPADLQDQG